MQQTLPYLSNSADLLQESESMNHSKTAVSKAELICAECEKHHATFHCEECGQNLCPKCDKKLHNKGKRVTHLRDPLPQPTAVSHLTSSDEKTDKTSSVRSSLEQLSLTSKKVGLFMDNKDSIKTGTTKGKSNMGSDEGSNQTKNNMNILEKLNDSPNSDNKTQEQEKVDKFEKLHQSLNITVTDNHSLVMNESHFVNQSFTEDFAREIPICDFQEFKSGEILKSQEMAIFIQNLLRSHADKGDVIVKKEVFEQEVLARYKTVEIASLLKEAEEKKVIQIISRKFGDSKPHFYISLLLDSLSIQALFWTIKSLINDQLTPNEKMLVSRIKEAFAIKLNPVTWQGIWKFIEKKARDHENLIIVPKLPTLKIYEVFNQHGTLMKILTLKEAAPLLIDQESLNLKDQEIWDEFLKFLDCFFEEKTFTKKAEKAKWSCSVETFLSKNKTKPLIIPPKSSSKAIPGGKYGCAQLIKCCGPENLAKLSLGKLSVLAQEAINRKLLDHYKTLLIKSTRFTLGIKLNDNPLDDFKPEEKNPEIKQKIQSIKSIILDLLSEAPNGISLAKLPAEIKRKVNFYYDLHEIGFNKLKDVLAELPNVEIIEMKGSKLAIAKLKKAESFSYDYKNNSESESFGFKGFNEVIRKVIENNANGITGPELIESVRKMVCNNQKFHHILYNNTTFFSYLMQNFADAINIEFKNETLIIRQKNKLNASMNNIIPKNLLNNASYVQNETINKTVDINFDSNIMNSASKSYNFFNSTNNNNQNSSLFNTNFSSINQTMTPFLSNNDDNNRSYEEIVKVLQKTSMEPSHGSYSYFGNRTSLSKKNEEKEKPRIWVTNSEPKNQDADVMNYLSTINKSKENNSISGNNAARFKTH